MGTSSNFLIKSAPMIFVILWATGFVSAKYASFDAEPLTFLATRFAITAVLLGCFVLIWLKPKRTDMPQILHSVLIGVFMQGLYLGGVFYAVHKGMPAGISSLVAALQPFVTALLAWFWLKEQISLLRVVCFVFALAGIYVALFPGISFQAAIPGITAETLIAVLISPIALSIGAVYQKRMVTSLNVWSGTAAQFVGAGLFIGLLSILMEDQVIIWSTSLILTMTWLVLVLSIGAVGLLMYLIRQGDSSSVASLFFLVPVVSLAMNWVLFDETINTVQMVGSLVVVASVAVSSRYG